MHKLEILGVLWSESSYWTTFYHNLWLMKLYGPALQVVIPMLDEAAVLGFVLFRIDVMLCQFWRYFDDKIWTDKV